MPAAVPFPLLTVTDDAGAIVAGATVTIASVLDVDGTPIASPAAVLHFSGPNVSVVYDAETKGEAWLTLAVSKAGSTFTGWNAAPTFFLARDSGRLDAAVSSRSTLAGPANFSALAITSAGKVALDLGQLLTFRVQNGVTAPTLMDALAVIYAALACLETKPANPGPTPLILSDPAGNPILRHTLDSGTNPTTRTPAATING